MADHSLPDRPFARAVRVDRYEVTDRSIDEADITARSPVLAGFIEAASIRYSVARAPIAVGLQRCDHGGGTAPDPLQALGGCHPVSAALTIHLRPADALGWHACTHHRWEVDSRRSPGDGARLAERLIQASATVTHHVLPVRHSITALDREIARDWLG